MEFPRFKEKDENIKEEEALSKQVKEFFLVVKMIPNIELRTRNEGT